MPLVARLAALAALTVVAAACATAPPPAPAPAPATPPTPAVAPAALTAASACAATRIAPEGADRLGALTFLDGYRLQATQTDFGGLSGLDFAAEDGVDVARFGGVTDAGAYFALAVTEGGDVLCTLTPLRDGTGAPLAGKTDGDSEGFAFIAADAAMTSFERRHRIERIELGSGRGAPGPAIGWDFDMEPNAGLEALAILADGTLVAGGETTTSAGTPHPVWAFAADGSGFADGAGPTFSIATDPGYGLTGFAATPDGGLVTLQRFFTPLTGARIRIGLVTGDQIATAVGDLGGQPVAPRILAEITRASSVPVDNFEGVAARETPDGLEIWIVSDDNFSGRQKTLLYRFLLPSADGPAA